MERSLAISSPRYSKPEKGMHTPPPPVAPASSLSLPRWSMVGWFPHTAAPQGLRMQKQGGWQRRTPLLWPSGAARPA